jgi:ABC-2 type transport system ATP-binding protein
VLFNSRCLALFCGKVFVWFPPSSDFGATLELSVALIGRACFLEDEGDNRPMSSPVLTIEHLRVDFPEVVAVNDLSLTVEAGDVCGLIGPNGAGKTTTMRAVSGLQECTRGSVKVDGYELAREPEELKKRLGFMPDFCPVYDQLTATEFLDHFARAYDVPDRTKRIEECLELTWLTEKRDALCEELSRGMKQRLVLAKTLLPNPQVLLLDEPASGLDPLGRIELRKLLLQLRDAGKTVLISSHILTELSGFCNKAAIMERGKLVMSGTIAELGQKMGRRQMSVKWRNADDQALQILKGAGVKNLETAAQGATFEFDGDTDALDGLLKTLVVEGVRVTEWRGSGDDLEQIFLQSGAKELM